MYMTDGSKGSSSSSRTGPIRSTIGDRSPSKNVDNSEANKTLVHDEEFVKIIEDLFSLMDIELRQVPARALLNSAFAVSRAVNDSSSTDQHKQKCAQKDVLLRYFPKSVALDTIQVVKDGSLDARVLHLEAAIKGEFEAALDRFDRAYKDFNFF